MQAKQRRRLLTGDDGAGVSSASFDEPSAAARDIMLLPGSRTQVDGIQIGAMQLLDHLSLAAPRPPLVVSTHDNVSVKVNVDTQAAGILVRQELLALARLTEQLADKFIAEAARVLGECAHNGEQLVQVVQRMFVPAGQDERPRPRRCALAAAAPHSCATGH